MPVDSPWIFFRMNFKLTPGHRLLEQQHRILLNRLHSLLLLHWIISTDCIFVRRQYQIYHCSRQNDKMKVNCSDSSSSSSSWAFSIRGVKLSIRLQAEGKKRRGRKKEKERKREKEREREKGGRKRERTTSLSLVIGNRAMSFDKQQKRKSQGIYIKLLALRIPISRIARAFMRSHDRRSNLNV